MRKCCLAFVVMLAEKSCFKTCLLWAWTFSFFQSFWHLFKLQSRGAQFKWIFRPKFCLKPSCELHHVKWIANTANINFFITQPLGNTNFFITQPQFMQIMPFLKGFELGQKLGFWPIYLATDMLASQSRAL